MELVSKQEISLIKAEVSQTAWAWEIEIALDMDIALTIGSWCSQLGKSKILSI